MGLDGVNFGKDYAAEFGAKQNANLEDLRQKLNKVGVTVPMVQQKTNLEKPIAGAQLEHTEKPAAEKLEQPEAKPEAAKAEAPAPNDPQYRVFSKRTITDDASLQAKEDEMTKNYHQVKSMSDDEVKAFAKKYVENELPKDADKQLIADTENGIIEAYNNIKSMSDEDIKKTAKYYANNVRNQENFDNTVVYYDKAEYKAAEAERKEARKQLVAQFRNEGLSKREAKKKADSMLVKNEYLGKTLFGIHSARKAVTNNKELFFDENGKFSNEKYHEFALKQSNINNQNFGEETDYTFSLKERRKADIDNVLQDASMTTLGKVVRKSGIKTERNNTALYRGLVIAGLIGAGAATGGITATATAGSASASTAGAAAGSAAAAGAASGAAAGATATAHISGAFLGGAASPLALLFSDKGKKDRHALKVYSYTEQPQPQPQPQPVVTPQPPVEECPRTTYEIKEEYCPHTVQKKGRKTELWHTLIPNTYRHADGTKLSGKEAKAVWQELKRKNGVALDDNIMPNVVNLFTNVNGIQYKVNCDAKPVLNTVIVGKQGKTYTKGESIIDSEFCGEDCNQTYTFPSKEAAEEWKRTGVLPQGATVRNN